MKYLYILLIGVGFAACNSNHIEENTKEEVKIIEAKEVNVYTHRHYPADQELFSAFETKTGIKVNVVNAKADELIHKMTIEGEQSPADVLITVDAGRLVRAKAKGLLQKINSDKINSIVSKHLRDKEGYWFALTKRARVIVYSKERVQPEQLSTYENLMESTWKNKILVRSSNNIYNQSLLASIITNKGMDFAKKWAESLVANMARDPKGNDRDQVKAVMGGEGDIAIVNTYYIGKLLNSENQEEVKAGQSVGIFFPNQNDRGTHINISGAGVAKHAPNKENAIQFIEFLLSEEAQAVFAKTNFEYPVNKSVKPSKLLESWGDFKEDSISLSELGNNNKLAVILFDEAGWK